MIAIVAFALLLVQDDVPEWGGFRGNNGCGVASSKAIPESLDPEETALWRVEVPSGYSSPIVAGERVFLTGVDGEKLITLGLDRHSGDELWRREIDFDGRKVGMNSSATPSPVTDGERVYVLFQAFGLAAYDVKGNELWQQKIGPFDIPHGMATSPVLHGDVLVQVVDQDSGSYVAAYDKLTGKERWKVERQGVTHSYATPAIYAPKEGPAQVIVSGALQIKSYSVADGKLLWWVDGSAWQSKCVPVVVGDRCFVNAYMPSSSEIGLPSLQSSFADELAERDTDEDGQIGRDEWAGDMIQQVWFIFDLDGDEELGEADWEFMKAAGRSVGGLFSIDLTGEGDVTESHVEWRFGDRRGLPDCPTPLVMDGLLYVVKEGGLFTAIDAGSGEMVKQERIGSSDDYYASPVAGAGRIVTASLGGQLSVIEAGRAWRVLSVSDLEEKVWSTPAIADGQVFVRSQEALWCFASVE